VLTPLDFAHLDILWLSLPVSISGTGSAFKVGVDMKIANLSDSTGLSGRRAGLIRMVDGKCQHPSKEASSSRLDILHVFPKKLNPLRK
jgi:hypothetical protein